jgi:hypothetical protein
MKKVPFFANTPDDTHCVQAGFATMLKFFLPERDFSYERLDEMSQRQPGKGTWWPPMLIELQNLGLEVKCIEGFDYKRFSIEGKPYVRSLYRPETAEYYLNHSNLMEIRGLIPKFLKNVDVQMRPATIDDLVGLLADGWLVGIDLNAVVLNDLDRDDYVGHMVVLFDASKDNFWLHDPGLPPRPNIQVSRQKIQEAWFWSGRETAGLVAVKRAGQ